MKMTLDVWQRVKLAEAIGIMRGTLAQLRAAGKVLDILELSDDEKKAAGYIDLGNGNATYADITQVFDLDFGETALRLIKDSFTKYPGWQFGDKRVEELADLLGVEEVEE